MRISSTFIDFILKLYINICCFIFWLGILAFSSSLWNICTWYGLEHCRDNPDFCLTPPLLLKISYFSLVAILFLFFIITLVFIFHKKILSKANVIFWGILCFLALLISYLSYLRGCFD